MHIIGAFYVQRVAHALNDHFLNLPIFNAANFFNLHNYSSDDSDQILDTKLWLERILLNFQYIDEESDMCVRENSWNLLIHFNMSSRLERYLRLGACVVAIWNGTHIGLDLYNFGTNLYSFHQVYIFMKEDFSNKMQ